MKELLLETSFDPKNQDFRSLTKFYNIRYIGLNVNIVDLEKMNLPKDIIFFSRLLIRERDGYSSNKIKSILQRSRSKYHIISVEPLSASVAAIASRDRRVDSIRISSSSKLKVINTRYGRRLNENNKLVEIDLSVFWGDKIGVQLRPLIRVLRSLRQNKLGYILTKEHPNISKIRGYRGLQSIARLLEISNKDSDTTHIIQRINTNIKKLIGTQPLEGVEIIKW